MPVFVKIERGIVPKAEFDPHVHAHLEYVRQLREKGHQAKTGYWRQSSGGMLIFEAASRQEAEVIVQADPLIANGCVEYELHEWVELP